MKGDGQYGKRLQELSKMDVLVLDDFGLSALSEAQQWDLLEILDDRHNKCSTVVTSQIPVKLWHDTLNDKTLADAILDRLIHNAHRLEMKGESMRKKQSTLITESEPTQNTK
jgi:DNA replication protein DnaC